MHRNGKTALSKIEDHEKLCRMMQRETFKRIDQLYQRIERLERVIMTSAANSYCSNGRYNYCFT
jgi:hypothetical protein